MRFAFMIGILACGLSAQDFTLPTPKGDLIVRVSSNSFYLSSFFTMKGTITNTTNWDFKYVTMRVAFYDSGGREMTELCGEYQCITPAQDIPAGGTVPLTSDPGPNTSANTLNPPRASSYKLFFNEGFYRFKWAFSLIKPTPSDTLSFDDEALSVTFFLDPDGISCNLRNKTNDPITINWNNVSWVDESSIAHKLIHTGIRLADKEAPQTPTVIPPLARIEETMFPAEYVKSTARGWSKGSMWPVLGSLSEDQSALKRFEESTSSVFMPLEVHGKTKNYNFVFKVTSFEY